MLTRKPIDTGLTTVHNRTMYIPIGFSYHRHSERNPDPVAVRNIGDFIALNIGNSVSVFLTAAQLEEIRVAIVAYQDAQILQAVPGGLVSQAELDAERDVRVESADIPAAPLDAQEYSRACRIAMRDAEGGRKCGECGHVVGEHRLVAGYDALDGSAEPEQHQWHCPVCGWVPEEETTE